MKLTITDIQRFCMHDGPGIRTTVFFKGCPLRCKWCHNPETQEIKKQILYYPSRCIKCGVCTCCPGGAHHIDDEHVFHPTECIQCGLCAKNCPTKALEAVGKTVEAEDVIDQVFRDSDFYGESGGVTLSGGEPMFQPEATLYLLRELKNRNINTALETCGHFDSRYLSDLVKYTDTFLWDVKDTNSDRHRENTGVSNERILDNLRQADRLGAGTILRCIIVNGVNTDEDHYHCIAELFHELKHCQGVELLAYHTYGGSKHQALYGVDNARKEWIPSKLVMDEIRNTLMAYEVNVL